MKKSHISLIAIGGVIAAPPLFIVLYFIFKLWLFFVQCCMEIIKQ